MEGGSHERQHSPTPNQLCFKELEELVERLRAELCLVTIVLEAQQRELMFYQSHLLAT